MAARTFFFFLALLATYLVRDNFFFWDTVQLGSKHAHYFYETGFQSIILPEVIDSGHIPTFGMYLALCWKWFGKTLAVSHFAMLPFLFGIVYFLEKIAGETAPKKYAPWLVVLCFADPVLAGQATLVSPDVALVCFFLMALWAIWTERKNWLLTLAVIGLGLTSMRGMSLGVGLFFFAWIGGRDKISVPSFFKKIGPFVPGGLIALAFLFYHYHETGWIGYHEGSTWAPCFERVGFRGFVKNLALLTWRLLDFGRVFIWPAFLVGGYFFWKKTGKIRAEKNSTLWRLLVLLLVVFIALVLNQLPYKGLLAHRYLMPVFLSLNFLVFSLVFNELGSDVVFGKIKKPLFVLLLVGFATGSFWVYPKKVSQGWDGTLAHLPWYGLEKEAEAFLAKQKIPMEKVGTAFPNIGPREMIELNGVGEGFPEKDLTTDCYVMYSNVMNDFPDGEIDELEQSWEEIFKKEKGGLCLIVYKSKKTDKCGN